MSYRRGTSLHLGKYNWMVQINFLAFLVHGIFLPVLRLASAPSLGICFPGSRPMMAVYYQSPDRVRRLRSGQTDGQYPMKRIPEIRQIFKIDIDTAILANKRFNPLVKPLANRTAPLHRACSKKTIFIRVNGIFGRRWNSRRGKANVVLPKVFE